MKLLKETVQKIGELNQEKMSEARKRLDSLTKPPGSLGKLEELAIKLAGISGELFPRVDHKAHILMAGDHGVVAEGISAFPQEVTTQMIYNFLHNGAAINVLAKQMGVTVTIIDIGVAGNIEAEGLVVRKVKPGTDNFVLGPAMSHQEAVACLETGIEVVSEIIDQGANLIGTGEMGIGNTTSSSAILAAITGLPLEELVGRGTGIDEGKLEHKRGVISRALKVNRPDSKNGIDVLTKVGGLEIGGLAGVMLGSAARRAPVVVDGLISGAAALIACQIEPLVKDYLIPSHRSVEPGHIKIYEYLGLEPMLELKMRLGEGTGAVLAMNLVEAATRIIREMATFEEARISGKLH
jgi:nicotinate-nucleotide--dimethylbenzimidazole phosphoribosyltransferase